MQTVESNTFLLQPPSFMLLPCQCWGAGERWCVTTCCFRKPAPSWIISFLQPFNYSKGRAGRPTCDILSRKKKGLFFLKYAWVTRRINSNIIATVRHPRTGLCANICVKSDIWYGRRKKRRGGQSVLKSWPDSVGAGGGGKGLSLPSQFTQKT